jgi:hypothetical protein
MDIGKHEPSLLSGAGGFGTLLGLTVIALLGTIPSTKMHILIFGSGGRTITLFTICVIIAAIIFSYFYFKKNDKWKKIIEHYEQKKIKCEFLVFTVYTIFMYLFFLGAIPFVIKQIIKLCS